MTDAALPQSIERWRLQDWLHRHPRLLVIGGAGCSTEVGIPDYRDRRGQWKRPQPVTYQAFMGDEWVRKRYWARSMLGWAVMGRALPGAAHQALALLEQQGKLELLITQNVDGLHTAAGSHRVVDLHGRIDTVICMDCGLRHARADLQQRLRSLNPDWAVLQASPAPDGDADLEGQDFRQFVLPFCPHCGTGMIKPDVVFFGETVPLQRVRMCHEALAKADAVLVAGSSLMVYSGYRFVLAAHAQGKSIVAINQGVTRADALLDYKVEADVGRALMALTQG